MQKLLYISNLRLPTQKAYGVQIGKMCEAFAVFGMSVSLVYPYRRNPNIKKEVFEYYSLRDNFSAKCVWAPDLQASGQLSRVTYYLTSGLSAVILSGYALVRKFDVIYSRDELPLYLLSFFRKNLVFEIHRFSRSRSFLYRRFKKLRIKVVAISEGLVRELKSFGFRSEDILLARDGVDVKQFDIKDDKQAARARLKIRHRGPVVMYTGHLFEWKGVDTLAAVAQHLSDAHFYFVGGMPADTKKFREKFGGQENIHILGQRSYREMPYYLKAADVLIAPTSAREPIGARYTSPLKVFEYMASGRPIVASDTSAMREILNKQNAVLVQPDDSEAFAAGIQKVLEDRDMAESISRQALRDVQEYTWKKRAERIIAFLKHA